MCKYVVWEEIGGMGRRGEGAGTEYNARPDGDEQGAGEDGGGDPAVEC